MRSSRLLAILILLQLRTRLTAEELAAEFEVSVRTIYRDIDALSAAGVPVYGEKGPGGGFRLLDGYRTRLTGLDAGEAAALPLIGLPGPAAALGMGAEMQRARGKLLASLPERAAEGAGRIAERFHLDTLDWYRSGDATPHLAALARAVLDDQPVTMTYDGWRGVHDWAVAPLGLVIKGGAWYLVAMARGKVRSFRVSNIRTLALAQGAVVRPPAFDLAAYWADSLARFEQDLRPLTAHIRLPAVAARRLARDGAYAAEALAAAPPPDEQDWQQLALPIETLEQGALLLLGIGAPMDVLDPPALADEMVRQAKAMIERLETRHDD